MYTQRPLPPSRRSSPKRWVIGRRQDRTDRWGCRGRATAVATASFFTLAVLGIVAATPASASTVTVSNLNDSGPGSLRDAINQANNEGTNPGVDTITFQ